MWWQCQFICCSYILQWKSARQVVSGCQGNWTSSPQRSGYVLFSCVLLLPHIVWQQQESYSPWHETAFQHWHTLRPKRHKLASLHVENTVACLSSSACWLYSKDVSTPVCEDGVQTLLLFRCSFCQEIFQGASGPGWYTVWGPSLSGWHAVSFLRWYFFAHSPVLGRPLDKGSGRRREWTPELVGWLCPGQRCSLQKSSYLRLVPQQQQALCWSVVDAWSV